MADRIVWDFSDQKVTWKLIRGRMGFRPGEMVLKGEGSTPVISLPGEPPIDWSRYESMLIRMIAEGGHEIKIKLGNLEQRKKLAPPMQYQVYRFDLNLTESTFNRPLAIMPTDHIFALVAIDFIELVPRKASFPDPAGRLVIGKREEYRNTLYAHAPSSITYEVPIPKGARLHFGTGVVEKKPVTFRIVTGASNTELYAKTLDNPDTWEDAEVDLSAYEGRNIKLAFQTSSAAHGAVGLWANPLMTTIVPKDRPNVLLYLVCTLRPEHTSLYGYARDTTPFLKKLGASSVVFDDCQAQATWTKPSVASMMTSLYSFNHGIIKETDTIPKGAATMAEQLRAAGYVTASMVANPFAGRTTGLDRGFDYIMEYPVVHRYREDSSDRGTDSAALNHLVLPWLERHRDEPFFLYVQSTDPHAPYRPPAYFESMFANPAETTQFNRDYARLRELRGYGGGASISRAECRAKGIDPDLYYRRAIDRYDGEIAHNDRSIELVVKKLKELGIQKNTLIVIASDHGEEFWEHGWSAHGHTLYQELAHTVFLMWNSELLPTPRRVAEPVQLIDVMPTVLDLLDVEIEGLTQGQSLASLAKGLPFQRKGPVMSSRFAHHNAKRGGVPENRTGTFAWLDRNWKLIYRDQAKRARMNRVELYERGTDRAETKNVAAQHPQVVDRLMGEVNQWTEAQKQVRKLLGPGGETTLDPQTIERLRSLGYIGGKPTE
jgi:arylsulfatase A-like enzyme